MKFFFLRNKKKEIKVQKTRKEKKVFGQELLF